MTDSMSMNRKNIQYGDWMQRQEDTKNFSYHKCFGRSRVHDLRYISIGQSVAIPLNFNQVKYIEPRSDILEYEFNMDS